MSRRRGAAGSGARPAGSSDWSSVDIDRLAGVLEAPGDFATAEVEALPDRWFHTEEHMPRYPYYVVTSPPPPEAAAGFAVQVLTMSDACPYVSVRVDSTSTVARVLEDAFALFRRRLGYAIDESGPDDYGLRFVGRADYLPHRSRPLTDYRHLRYCLRRGETVRLAIVSLNGEAEELDAAYLAESEAEATGSYSMFRVSGTSWVAATVLFAYDGRGCKGSIPIHEGERVDVQPVDGNPWWMARTADGRSGVVPNNYLQLEEAVVLEGDAHDLGKLLQRQRASDPRGTWQPSSELVWPVRVRIRGLEGVQHLARKAGAPLGQMVLRVELAWQGEVKHVQSLAPVADPGVGSVAWRHPQALPWVQFRHTLAQLPMDARLCFTVESIAPDTGKRTVMGGNSMTLFDHRLQLRAGRQALTLWAATPALPWGPTPDNADPASARMYLQFDSFRKRAFFDLPPAIPLRSLPPLAEEFISEEVERLLLRDPLHSFTAAEAASLWDVRELLTRRPAALGRLLGTVDWSDAEQVREVHRLLALWTPPTPLQAMELLTPGLGDYRVREYAVRCLDALPDSELADLQLQLTQAVKHDLLHFSPLARFLVFRAVRNPREVGHKLFWHLRSEMHSPAVCIRFGAMLRAFLTHAVLYREKLRTQARVVQLLQSVAEAVGAAEDKPSRLAILRRSLTDLNDVLPDAFQLCLDPRMEVTSVIVEKCKVMNSKKRPLWLVFTNSDPLGEPYKAMFKAGDDLRQDQMTLQMLRFIDRLWNAEGLDMRLTTYDAVATGDELGMLEIVVNSDTTANIQKRYGGSLGALKSSPLMAWLEENNRDTLSCEAAVDNFIRSCAGYCVATYVMGIGDRHSDNIMCTKWGHLFHIDFGHFLGHFKSKRIAPGLKFKRERAPFVFTEEMAFVMGGRDGAKFQAFVDYCCQAYNILRKHGPTLINLFVLMIPAGMPELTQKKEVEYLKNMLSLEMSTEEASEKFKAEINTCLADTYRRIDNLIHNLKVK